MVAKIAERLWSSARDWAEDATGSIDNRLNEHRIRLAVTGLSRSGKTVFITSLIHNLIALGRGRDTLPRVSRRLSQNGRNRLKGVKLLPPGTQTLPYFDFPARLAELAGSAGTQPKWPERTQNLAQISIELHIEHESTLRQKLGDKRVRLDILDYPGEWLLDLPLLDQSFVQWSTDTLQALMLQPQRRHAAQFLDFLQIVSPKDPASDERLRCGHQLYRQAIQACREEAGLRYLQPGRFLCPGPQGDAPFMWFFPLPVGEETPASGSMAALLRDRFETYKRQVRTDFFDSQFKSFDRQIVLVDVLDALYAGQTAFEDTSRAILDIAITLRDGWGFWSKRRFQAISDGIDRSGGMAAARSLQTGGWAVAVPVAVMSTALSAMVAPRHVDRVAFVATKADHVANLNRTNLCKLLEDLAKPTATCWETAKARASYHVAASVRSTEDCVGQDDGLTVEMVQGLVPGDSAEKEDKLRLFNVGQVPAAVPSPTYWNGKYFRLPVFRPPTIDPSGALGIRHLNLDEVLDAIIGDLL